MTSKPSTRLLTTLEVEAIINGLAGETFTTRDIAKIAELSKTNIDPVRVEYSVRAGIQWLLERGRVVRCGEIRRPSPNCYPYVVTTYRSIRCAQAVDFNTLYRVLGMLATPAQSRDSEILG